MLIPVQSPKTEYHIPRFFIVYNQETTVMFPFTKNEFIKYLKDTDKDYPKLIQAIQQMNFKRIIKYAKKMKLSVKIEKPSFYDHATGEIDGEPVLSPHDPRRPWTEDPKELVDRLDAIGYTVLVRIATNAYLVTENMK